MPGAGENLRKSGEDVVFVVTSLYACSCIHAAYERYPSFVGCNRVREKKNGADQWMKGMSSLREAELMDGRRGEMA